jgi:hypothetical protein
MKEQLSNQVTETSVVLLEDIPIEESARLVELEQTIKAGLDTFVEVGQALLEIRDSKLYRIAHTSFEDYCRSKWGMKKQSAYQLISGAQVTQSLQSHNCDFFPTKQAQTRPIANLPREQQVEAWKKAVDIAGGKQPTGKQVEAAVVEVTGTSREDAKMQKLQKNFAPPPYQDEDEDEDEDDQIFINPEDERKVFGWANVIAHHWASNNSEVIADKAPLLVFQHVLGDFLNCLCDNPSARDDFYKYCDETNELTSLIVTETLDEQEAAQ